MFQDKVYWEFRSQKRLRAMADKIKSVNIPEMDQQHQDLWSAVVALKESSRWVEELGGVIDAVEAHFRAEEALFDKYQIPNETGYCFKGEF